jgi:DNA invertase Pin-like site-specific DNA recombinase
MGLCNIPFMRIGYARVSTQDQDTAAQLEALTSAGVEKVYEEKASGGRFDRPELMKMLDHCRKGDVIVVWKLDRLSRSLRDLLTILERMDSLGVGFVSLTEAIDTTTAAGRLMMQIVGAFSEFERSMIRARTKIGLERAKSNGVKLGRKKSLSKEQSAKALELLKSGESGAGIAKLFDVHPSTISRLKRGIEGVTV